MRKWPLLLLALARVAVLAANDRVQSCEESWKRALAAAQLPGGDVDYKSLLGRWTALESQCKGTGVYEFRFATLYLEVDQPQRAAEVLDSVKSFPQQYAQLLPFVRLRAELMALARENPVPMDKVRALKPRFMAVLDGMPPSYAAYDQFANYLMVIDDMQDAITYGEKSIALREDQWDTNRSLAIAYMSTGNYTKSIRCARRAQELRNSLISDPPFMYAVAKSYAGIGNITVAKKTMGMLLDAKPTERGSPEYRDAISFIVAEVKKGNVRN